jgi:hypothetical protein
MKYAVLIYGAPNQFDGMNDDPGRRQHHERGEAAQRVPRDSPAEAGTRPSPWSTRICRQVPDATAAGFDTSPGWARPALPARGPSS